MGNLEQFRNFAKYSKGKTAEVLWNAIIYTRVSTKEQAETNKSLDTQKSYCNELAEKKKLTVLGEFGGTYESANSDERKEFQRMLNFIKNSKVKIGYIIVYSYDRFSRTGENAIYIAKQLREQGVKITSVIQPTDTDTASGIFQQNIQFIFSQYDNDLRREKCITGMVEKLRSGWWTGKAPVGYDQLTQNGEQKILVNEKGKLIRKAFLMKVNEGLSNTEIVTRCKALGLNITMQRLTDIFKNPFYCGIISHNLLNGELVQGKHEAMITEKIFLKVNNLTATHPQGYIQNFFDDNLPLKSFVKCAACETPMTGYLNRKKNIHYYKCNKIGCGCNGNAKKLHLKYNELMSQYSLDGSLMKPLEAQLRTTYHFMNRKNEETTTELKGRLGEIQQMIDTIEERFVLGKIERPLYEKHIVKFIEEKKAVDMELQKVNFKLSNLNKYIDFSITIAGNLNKIWHSSNYQMKQKVQYLVFPEGILFDKKSGNYLTNRVNSVFACMSSVARGLQNKESGQTGGETNLSALVVPARIELASKV